MQKAEVSGSRNDEHIPASVERYALELEERLASESRRYQRLYNIDPYDVANHDLVIDSGKHTLDEVVEKILSAYKSWQNDTDVSTH
jgi:cytidylate kinase